MSHVCDPRNRPGYDLGTVPAELAEPLDGAPANPADDLRTVLLAWFSSALIVAVVTGLVLATP